MPFVLRASIVVLLLGPGRHRPPGPQRNLTTESRRSAEVTLPLAKAKGLLAAGHPASELLARCPRELLRAAAPRYVEASMRPRMTAPVVLAGGLPSATPRPFDRLCRSTGPKATARGFIARANLSRIAPWLPSGKGPFIPMPEVRGPLAPGWVGEARTDRWHWLQLLAGHWLPFPCRRGVGGEVPGKQPHRTLTEIARRKPQGFNPCG
jgi:hypothetical protein